MVFSPRLVGRIALLACGSMARVDDDASASEHTNRRAA
jgi:hypothetical protein